MNEQERNIPMDTIRFEEEDIDIVAELLMEGSVVAFPTDTVYGLGVVYDDEAALLALKKAKGRPETKPIPTMIGTIDQLEQVAVVSKSAKRLAEAFMPGAITLIMKKKEEVPGYVTNGLATIGVRMPDDEFVCALIEKCGKPLLVTSANKSGEETGINDVQVLSQLDGDIDAIVLGEAKGKLASTIIDVSTEEVKILRDGPITKAQIEAVLTGKNT